MVYSLAITITLRTPAPPCPPSLRFLLSLSLSLSFVLLSLTALFLRVSSFSSPSSGSTVRSLSLFDPLRFFAMSRPSFLPPSRHDHPVALTTAIPQLFSTFLALIAALPLANGEGGGCLPFTPRTLPGFLSLRSSSLSGSPGRGVYFSTRRTYHSTLLPLAAIVAFHSRNGHRNS